MEISGIPCAGSPLPSAFQFNIPEGFIEGSVLPDTEAFPPFKEAGPADHLTEEERCVCRKGTSPVRQIESRQKTFYKRGQRFLKKAQELSVLCDAEVGAIVFSPSGNMSEFASSSMSHIIKRYQSFQPQMPSNDALLQDVEVHDVYELEVVAEKEALYIFSHMKDGNF